MVLNRPSRKCSPHNAWPVKTCAARPMYLLMADFQETDYISGVRPLRLNITASSLHSVLQQDRRPRYGRNRKLERIAALQHAPRHGYHFAFIYPFPSLIPTY